MKTSNIVLIGIILMLTLQVSNAHKNHNDTSKALSIIERKVPCNDLSENDLEVLGDYYMELMHPGDEHKRMDSMMGGENSDTLRMMHVNMGRNFYCNNQMGMMFNSGMMFSNYENNNYNWRYIPYLNILFIVVTLALLLAIFLQLRRR